MNIFKYTAVALGLPTCMWCKRPAVPLIEFVAGVVGDTRVPIDIPFVVATEFIAVNAVTVLTVVTVPEAIVAVVAKLAAVACATCIMPGFQDACEKREKAWIEPPVIVVAILRRIYLNCIGKV